MTFVVHQPIGGRACGGEPNTFTAVAQCGAEISALANNQLDPELPSGQADVLKGKLLVMINAVREGALDFTATDPAASVLSRHDCLYELRPRLPKGRLIKRELRMYCGEPAGVAGLVLGLHLATKAYADESSKVEQDRAIDEAVARAELWVLSRARDDLFSEGAGQ